MITLDKLIPLEKAPVINLSHCNVVENWYDEEKGIRTRILEKDGRFFLHEVFNDGTISCIEVAVEWRIRADRIRFAWTPDNRHILCIDSGIASPVYDVLKLDLDQIQPGDSCSYLGTKITYVDPTHIRLNDKVIRVIKDSEFTFQIKRNYIRAADGAAGFYRFCENAVAEETLTGRCPLFHCRLKSIFEFYNIQKKEVAA